MSKPDRTTLHGVIGSLTSMADVNYVFDLLRARRQDLEAAEARKFILGDTVEFNGRKNQGRVTGIVVGLTPRNVKVKALKYSLFGQPRPDEVWCVAPSFLIKIQTEKTA